jgi:type I restriction enzyme S subunit
VKFIRLNEVARIYNGNSINEQVKAREFTNLSGGTPYIATKDISYQFKVNYVNGVSIPQSKSKEFKIARNGSVLLCAEGGSAGRKMALIDRDVFFVNKLFCFECSDKLNNKFLFYYLQAPQFQLLFKNSITGLIGGVSLEKVRSLPIMLPSLQKQSEIVERLDSLFAEIDLLDSKQRELVKHATAMLESCIDELLLRNQNEKVPLTNFATLENGDRGSNYPNKKMREESGIPFINAGHISEGKLDISQMDYISQSTFNNLSRGKIQRNDLLFCLRGSLGKTALLSDLDEGAIASSLVIVRAKAEVDPKFLLYYFLSSLCKAQIEEFRSGTAQPNLGGADLKKFQVPKHSSSEMQEVVTKIDDIASQIVTLTKNIESRTIALNELRKSLLSSAFTQEQAVA